MDKSMRVNYARGVDSFYQSKGNQYKNPMEMQVRKACWKALDWIREAVNHSCHLETENDTRFLNESTDFADISHSFQPIFQCDEIICKVQTEFPMEPQNSQLLSKNGWRCLDLAAGSGEITQALLCYTFNQQRIRLDCIEAYDPFTASAYTTRCQRPCHSISFQDIVKDGDAALMKAPFDIVFISFALHLFEQGVQPLLMTLARRARYLVILSPHKKPLIEEIEYATLNATCNGWFLLKKQVLERIHIRVFVSAFDPIAEMKLDKE